MSNDNMQSGKTAPHSMQRFLHPGHCQRRGQIQRHGQMQEVGQIQGRGQIQRHGQIHEGHGQTGTVPIFRNDTQ
jgi:hypothetical protein